MKNVLITGGSRGIGRACVKLFSENGWRVFFTYEKNEEAARETAKNYNAIAIKCNAGVAAELVNIENEINKFSGVFDCIVNNAGISQRRLFTDITEEDWDTMFRVNVKSMYLIINKFVGKMIAQHSGSIVNISSIFGLAGGSCEVHYSASKAAVIGLTRSLACELGPSGIRVNCVAPGVIDTDMNSNLSKADMELLKDETPLCSIGSPEQIAKAVFFLADSESFITGEVLRASGGFN